jgi:GntR family transcriptional regulator
MPTISDSDVRSISSKLPTPLYHQLYSLLRQKIEAGLLRHGAVVPSELDLAARFSVSRITSKRALDELATDGFVERRRGCGTMVCYTYEPKVLRAPLTGMLESLHVMGRETTVKVLALERVGAPKHVAEALKLAPGALVDRAVRLRLNQGEPFAYYLSHTIPLSKPITAKQLATQTRLDIFKSMDVRLHEVDQVLSASGASADVAQALNVTLGAPLLSLTRTYTDQHQRRIDFLQGWYRPDRFQYHMHLSTAGHRQ